MLKKKKRKSRVNGESTWFKKKIEKANYVLLGSVN